MFISTNYNVLKVNKPQVVHYFWNVTSSGFDVRSQPTPAGPTAQVLDLSASALELLGSLILRWSSVDRAKSYELQFKDLGFEGTESDTTPWDLLVTSNAARHLADTLISGHIYQFRVRAFGPLGYGPWSDLCQSRTL